MITARRVIPKVPEGRLVVATRTAHHPTRPASRTRSRAMEARGWSHIAKTKQKYTVRHVYPSRLKYV